MKCHGCLKITRDTNFLTCSSTNCERSFCSLCISPSSLSTDKKRTWKCPDCCASQRKGGDNSSTPIRSLEDNVTKRKKTDINLNTNDNSEVKELVEEVRLLTREISSLKKQLENATSSLSSCQIKLEELGSSIAANDVRIQRLESRDQDVKMLETKVSVLQLELNMQAQYQLSNELELTGIPENGNENLHHLALLAARKVGVDLVDNDIDWVARAGPRVMSALSAGSNTKFPRPVVVRLLRRSKRDEIIKAARSRRNITSTDLELSGTPSKIYYNERLTKANRMLFREARARCKEYGYSFCWCSRGGIFIRQREGKPSIHIRTADDLARIFTPPN